MAKKFKGSLTLEWKNKNKSIILQEDGDNTRNTDVPLDTKLHWVNEDESLYYEVDANVLWMLDKEEKLSYSIGNSIIVGYNSLVNKGGGAHGFGEKADPAKIKINKDVILNKDGKLEIVDDQTSKLYLHIKPGTLGSNLGAGLFTK